VFDYRSRRRPPPVTRQPGITYAITGPWRGKGHGDDDDDE
jgi:hypothetical protein